ncbi:GNAT family N-acetyltransferase [Candidatus Bipolaricaulota bacterium]|nr:GNAT family N-acetyltransferase [Candidatus Bipolaricaulota bacterium]
MPKDCVLESEQLCFKPLEKKYLDRYVGWLNDPKLNRHLGPIAGALFTREKGEEWYDRMKEQDDKRIFSFHPKKGEGEPIGYCGLYRIDHRHERATVQVIIGEEEYRGRGFGTEITRLLLDYGFSFLSLDSVSLSFMETNSKARWVPKNLGFREAGRLRNYWKVDGNYYDRILMDITREEFYEENEAQIADNYLQTETKIKG